MGSSSQGEPPHEGPPASPPPGLCPACRSTELEAFFARAGVPIHTSALLASRDEAIGYPQADLDLRVCHTCGLMTNAAFDAAGHDYSASYEEVQSFSPRFRAYQSELAKRVVDRHELVGRAVFEIGSGRGDFLLAVCELTGGPGFAVDPSFSEASLPGPAAPRVRIDPTFFAARHLPAGVAAVLSRHTLEHVHDVRSFLGEVRQGLERAPEAAVVFEVPDTWRVLEETAFWDIFYEHCSYFTAGSLARAFREAGLPPNRIERTFEDQYIVVTARPGGTGEGDALPEEEAPDEIVERALGFGRRVEAAGERWRNLLAGARERGEDAVIWGAGSKGVGFLTMLGLSSEISCAVDVNPAKHGMFMPGTGHEVVAPERLVDLQPGLVVVMNPVYVEEIEGDLRRLGVGARVVAL